MPYDKLADFLYKIEQYELKFTDLANKLTVSLFRPFRSSMTSAGNPYQTSFENLQRRHVNVHMSEVRQSAYELRTMEFGRRRIFEEQWRAAKAKREALWLQLHQLHQQQDPTKI